MPKAQTKAKTRAISRAEGFAFSLQAALPALVALSIGIGVLMVAGFSQTTHDVAHDSRHAFSFPCH